MPVPTSSAPSLRIFREGYPRAYFFRSSENWAANARIDFEQWERTFNRLLGIEGKVLDEEVPDRSKRNIEVFTRFKKKYPDQLVLLHYNGDALNPDRQEGRFFAGHWIYFNGAKILNDIDAVGGETEIRVSDVSLFRVNIGNYRKSNEDIGLCELDAQGKPNWHASEQVQLLAVDTRNGVLRVRRGAFGTRPRAFSANRTMAAAHCTEGPWNEQWNLMWLYNYSPTCPRDANGKTCTDVLVEDLGNKFAAGGALEVFDGIQFDVLHHTPGEVTRGRGPDVDADGVADGGRVNGMEVYASGVIEFCRRLGERLGKQRLILADGYEVTDQRAFGILNGIESEGWPHLRDFEIEDWSGGLNRQSFWVSNSREPKFNYINHKFIEPSGTPGKVGDPQIPFSRHRLVFAAAQFTDSALCYNFLPPNEPGQLVAVWDELWLGAEHKLGWLGMPLGPAVHLADKQPNLLESSPRDLITRFKGKDVSFAIDGDAIKVSGADSVSALQFALADLRTTVPDLQVVFSARATASRPLPLGAARLMRMSFGTQAASHAWVNDRTFTYRHYRSNAPSGSSDLNFIVEGNEPIWISSCAAFAFADAVYREFERGLVLANPSRRPFTFDLAKLFPGKTWRRIKGSEKQDARTNDGSRVSESVILGERDALFLALAS